MILKIPRERFLSTYREPFMCTEAQLFPFQADPTKGKLNREWKAAWEKGDRLPRSPFLGSSSSLSQTMGTGGPNPPGCSQDRRKELLQSKVKETQIFSSNMCLEEFSSPFILPILLRGRWNRNWYFHFMDEEPETEILSNFMGIINELQVELEIWIQEC